MDVVKNVKGISDQFVGLMGKHIIINVLWKLRHARVIQELVFGIKENVENVMWNVEVMERRIPKNVFQNVVLYVAKRQKIVKDALIDVEMLILPICHMTCEWTNATPIDGKYIFALNKHEPSIWPIIRCISYVL